MNKTTIALVGNPNCGKSTIFNALTGSRQKVGNWSGVTVEKKIGVFEYSHLLVNVVDLPGTYNLVSASEKSALDEKIAVDFILSNQAQLIVNIIDAANLERNLYLTAQLFEMKVPMIIAVNMLDIARSKNIIIDLKKLEKELGVPVVGIEGNKKKGIDKLKNTIVTKLNSVVPVKVVTRHCERSDELFISPVKEAIQYLSTKITENKLDIHVDKDWLALRLLEGDHYAKELVGKDFQHEISHAEKMIQESQQEDADILIADYRYTFAHDVAEKVCQKGQDTRHKITTIIDNIVLNRILGIPIFLFVMYCLFFFAINIGGAFQDFFDIASDTIFVQGFAQVLSLLHFPAWLIALLASGVGKGINTTITFIPVIGTMFLFLSFLEDCGYMARAAFVMDRLMRALGLPGKSFVPLIVGFGCNVPAIMATRTLENQRDRILTVMMSPFMSCGARLAIFAVFTAAFFPVAGQNIVFALYIIGILCAVITGLILQKTILQGDTSPFVMELPLYHAPIWRNVWQQTWQRLRGFIFRAGRYIIPICIFIGVLNSITLNGNFVSDGASQQSLLAEFGKHLTPIFSPMGLHQDNWPATVGLLTGILAKEIVIGTLNTLYMEIGHLSQQVTSFNFWSGIHAAIMSIPQNFVALTQAFTNPVLASAPAQSINQGVFGQMYQRFDGQVGAFSYLLFVLLYLPCISTAAVIVRELGRAWMIFSIFWNTVLAYGVAVLFYQIANYHRHVSISSFYIGAVLSVFFAVFLGLYIFSRRDRAHWSDSHAAIKIKN